MWAYVSVFSVPKRGSKPDECEDAAWVGPDGNCSGDVTTPSLRIVVADGASESLLAGMWARRLTSTFGALRRNPAASKDGFYAAYRMATDSWAADIERYVAERQQRGAPIQWYEEPGLARGAFSTLITLQVSHEARNGRQWKAAAVGDSCLFLVRDERPIRCFPINDASKFSSSPALLPSRTAVDELVFRHLKGCRGEWMPGDTFYVATDALAAWFLTASGRGNHPWDTLRDLETVDFGLAFEDWVNDQRERRVLRDDDTTLVRLDLY
jgi:hypothetical protein